MPVMSGLGSWRRALLINKNAPACAPHDSRARDLFRPPPASKDTGAGYWLVPSATPTATASPPGCTSPPVAASEAPRSMVGLVAVVRCNVKAAATAVANINPTPPMSAVTCATTPKATPSAPLCPPVPSRPLCSRVWWCRRQRCERGYVRRGRDGARRCRSMAWCCRGGEGAESGGRLGRGVEATESPGRHRRVASPTTTTERAGERDGRLRRGVGATESAGRLRIKNQHILRISLGPSLCAK